ncbi:MAG: hypothetical protein LC634_10210 [Sphingomonadales bacterium]|nr:hypothetical protein [Sphingomonadales bacterium]
MSRRRIYLHAGMHKTGTTSIQKYLFDHSEAFEARGYAVFEDIEFGPFAERTGADRTNCFRLAHLLLRDAFGSPIKLRTGVRRYGPARRLGDIVRLRRMLRRIRCPNIVISAEAFCFLRTPGERALLRLAFAGFELVPVIFFRDSTDWLARQQGQLVNGVPDGYSAHALDFSPASDLVDYAAIRRLFGDGIYLDYEPIVAARGSVLPAFLEAIGIDPADMPAYGEYRDNPSAEKRDWSSLADQ